MTIIMARVTACWVGLCHTLGEPTPEYTSGLTAGIQMGVTTTSGTTYFSDCFSGIRLLDSWNIISGDLFFNLYGYEVTGGNFQMCIVHDGQVIATIEPTADGDVYFVMNDVDPGVYDLYIAGESAAFEFMSTDFDDEV